MNTYTKVDFDSYDINLYDPFEYYERKKSPPSMSINEISKQLKENYTLDPNERNKLEVECHRRWSLSAACMIFALLGVGLGTVTNRRSASGGGFVVCLVTLITYWALYNSVASMAQNGWIQAWAGLWLVNLLFLYFAIRTLRRVWA